MLGAMIGDICGSVYEWTNEKDIRRIELFKEGCRPTDDSVMTAAVARAFMDARGKSSRTIKEVLVNSMHYYGRLFPGAGYGSTFANWLRTYERRPYNSWGNGSAMRVSAIGWLYDSLEETLNAAALSAQVTHNHPEGIRGAQAIAAAIYLARNGRSKKEIREYVEKNFYRLDFTLDDIRRDYTFDVSCQGSCPQAIEAFLEGDSFEGVILKAISVGGDSDTIAAMAGGIAEAFYGIPEDIEKKAFTILVNTRYKGSVYPYSVLAEEVLRFRAYIGRSDSFGENRARITG